MTTNFSAYPAPGNTTNMDYNFPPQKPAFQDIISLENHSSPGHHSDRKDNVGLWNLVKAGYLYIFHLIGCILLFVSMTQWIDGHTFIAGSPQETIFERHTPLYQTQVNGLLSLALVLIRLLAGLCTALLIWTMILILLEKRGMSLAEIIRLNNYRIPIEPWKSTSHLLWFTWAVTATVLLWLPSFSAPLANSSLAWIPSTQILNSPSPISLSVWTDKDDFWALRAQEWRLSSTINAVVMAGSNPAYAFDRKNTQHRRYFQRPSDMTQNSTMNAVLPYFDVQLRWIDADSHDQTEDISNTKMSDFVNPGTFELSRGSGSVILVRNKQFDEIADAPTKPIILQDRRLVAIKVSGYGNGTQLPNGEYATADTPCPSTGFFPNLPKAQPYKVQFADPARNWSFWGADCYQTGLVTITAGVYNGTDCTVQLAGSKDASATCFQSVNRNDIDADRIAPVAIEMVSEIMKYVGVANFTGQWMANGLEDYTTGLLTLAYHAAWSSAFNTLTRTLEETEYKKAAPVVRASIERSRLYVWLAMQLCLPLAAVLVYMALSFSSVKVIRDTTLTALTLDFSAITHDPRASGLCNAVAISREDRKLPMLGLDEEGCRRRVVFKEDGSNVTRQRLLN